MMLYPEGQEVMLTIQKVILFQLSLVHSINQSISKEKLFQENEMQG